MSNWIHAASGCWSSSIGTTLRLRKDVRHAVVPGGSFWRNGRSAALTLMIPSQHLAPLGSASCDGEAVRCYAAPPRLQLNDWALSGARTLRGARRFRSRFNSMDSPPKLTAAKAFFCDFRVQFADGSVAVQASFSFGAMTNIVPIMGGTGAYESAGGYWASDRQPRGPSHRHAITLPSGPRLARHAGA
jgi:hypothetical protein